MSVQTSRSGGVYVGVRGDCSQLQKDLRAAADLAKKAGTNISRTFEAAVDSTKAAASFAAFEQALRRAENAGASLAASVAVQESALRGLNAALDATSSRLEKAGAACAEALKSGSLKTFSADMSEFERNAVALGDAITALAAPFDRAKQAVDTFRSTQSFLKDNIGVWEKLGETVGSVLSGTGSFGVKARSFAQMLGAGVQGVVSMLGGPWVAGISAAAAAVEFFSFRQSEAIPFAREYNSVVAGVKNSAGEAKSSLESLGRQVEALSKEHAKTLFLDMQPEIERREREFKEMIERVQNSARFAGAAGADPVPGLGDKWAALMEQFLKKEKDVQKFSDAFRKTINDSELSGDQRGMLATIREKVVAEAESLEKIRQEAELLKKRFSGEYLTSGVKSLVEANEELAASIRDYDLSPLEQQVNTIERAYANAKKEALELEDGAEKAAALENAELIRKKALLDLGKRRAEETKKAAEERTQYLAQEAEDSKNAAEETTRLLEQENASRLSFYKELAEFSGDYGAAVAMQNELLEEQAAALEKLEIPKGLIDDWKKFQQLQMGKDPGDGALRAVQKYAAEIKDQAKQVESAFSAMLSGIDDAGKSMWKGLIENGKLSLDSLKSVFNNFLVEMMHMAVTRPIMLQFMGQGAGGGLNNIFGGVVEGVVKGVSGMLDFDGGLLGAVKKLFVAEAVQGDAPKAVQGVVKTFSSSPYRDNMPELIAKMGESLGPTAEKALATYSATFAEKTGESLALAAGKALESYSFNAASQVEQTWSAAQAMNESFAMVAVDQLARQEVAQISAAAATSSAPVATAISGIANIVGALTSIVSVVNMFKAYGPKMNRNWARENAQNGAETGAVLSGVTGFAVGASLAAGSTAAGASIGTSVFPVVGTMIGAIIGAVLGASVSGGALRPPSMDIGGSMLLGGGEYDEAETKALLAGRKDAKKKYVLGDGETTTPYALWEKYFGSEFAKSRKKRNLEYPSTWMEANEYMRAGVGGYHWGAKTELYRLSGMYDPETGMQMHSRRTSKEWEAYGAVSEAVLQAMVQTAQTLHAYEEGLVVDLNSLGHTDATAGLQLGDQLKEMLRGTEIEFFKEGETNFTQKALDKMARRISNEFESAVGYAFTQLDLTALREEGYVVDLPDVGPKILTGLHEEVMSVTEIMKRSFAHLAEGTDEYNAKVQKLISTGGNVQGEADGNVYEYDPDAVMRAWTVDGEYENPNFAKNADAFAEMVKTLETSRVVEGLQHAAALLLQPDYKHEMGNAVGEALDAYDKELQKLVEERRMTLEGVQSLYDAYADNMTTKLFKAMDEQFINPLTTLDKSVLEVNLQFQDFVDSLNQAGASAEKLAQAEEMRIVALERMTAQMKASFYDDLRTRAATLSGGDAAGVSQEIKHRDQRIDAAANFGVGSTEYSLLLMIQEADNLRFAADAAQAELSRLENVYASASADEKNAENARLAFVTELVNGLTAAENAVREAIDSWAKAAKSELDAAQNAYLSALRADANRFRDLADKLRQAQGGFWTDSSLVPEESVYKSARRQMENLYAQAVEGDSDAASRLTSVAKEFLDASSSLNDRSDYLNDFYKVQDMLNDLADEAATQAGVLQEETALLEQQLGAQSKTNRTLEELKAEVAAAQAEFDRAHAEQMQAYDRWGFEAVAPGLAGLEAAYHSQTELFLTAEEALNEALLSGLTTQAEADSLRVVNKLEELRAEMEAAWEKVAENEREAGDLPTIKAMLDAAKIISDALNGTALEAGRDVEKAVNTAARDVEKTLEKIAPKSLGYLGSQFATEVEMLQAKAALMKAEKEDGRTNWSVASVRKKIESEFGGTGSGVIKQWWERYGEAELSDWGDGGGVYGSKHATEDALLKAKADQMNRDKEEGKSNWTIATVREAIEKAYGRKDSGVVGKWYIDSGRAEGFARGGTATPGWALVGEKGPELVNFAARSAVFPADVTRDIAMLASCAVGRTPGLSDMAFVAPPASDGSPGADRALLEELKEQNTTLRTQNRRLEDILSELRSIGRDAKQSADSLDVMSEDAAASVARNFVVRKMRWAD